MGWLKKRERERESKSRRELNNELLRLDNHVMTVRYVGNDSISLLGHDQVDEAKNAAKYFSLFHTDIFYFTYFLPFLAQQNEYTDNFQDFTYRISGIQ